MMQERVWKKKRKDWDSRLHTGKWIVTGIVVRRSFYEIMTHRIHLWIFDNKVEATIAGEFHIPRAAKILFPRNRRWCIKGSLISSDTESTATLLLDYSVELLQRAESYIT